MNRTRLVWQLLLPYLLLALIAGTAAVWYLAVVVSATARAQAIALLTERAKLLAERAGPIIGDPEETAKLCRGSVAMRLTVIRTDGLIIADSGSASARPEDPEVGMAMRGGVAAKTHGGSLFVAAPIRADGAVVGVARAAMPTAKLTPNHFPVYVGCAALALAIAFVSTLIAGRVARPIRSMSAAAERYAQGDFLVHLPQVGIWELAELRKAMLDMARQLDGRLRAVTSHQEEREAILAGMVESVLAVDLDDCILTLNPAAERVLGVSEDAVKGKPVQEAIRNADLLRFVSEALGAPRVTQREVALRGHDERFLLGTGTPLRDGSGKPFGALIVFNDVTELRRLERVRRDFVANVSHELKTPIAAIRGAVETLQSGAGEVPEDRARFLDMAARHAGRLGAIIDDLLALSQIEEGQGVVLEVGSVLDPLQEAVHECRAAAGAAGVTVALSCDPSLSAAINPRFLERAVTNLVDNAIRASEVGDQVSVEAERGAHFVRIRVRDQGSGIEPRHIPRLFERFYRVDTARSRAEGGTGLGLSIVKHIVHAHRGEIEVESEVGKGSVFTIRLPLPDPE